MGGRSSSSGLGRSFSSVGLKVEQEVDESRFNFFDLRYGSYARSLAQEMNESMDMNDEGSALVSYSNGNNIAYALIDTEADALEAIISTGGRTGTELLGRIMEHQQRNGKGLMWYADNPESIKYYQSMGLGEFGKGSSKSKMFEISPSDMQRAIKKVKK